MSSIGKHTWQEVRYMALIVVCITAAVIELATGGAS